MPMSPRLLRPMAAGGFDPRNISGCICNLDASVVSSLRQNSDGTTAATATNDPVGYFEDLSGLGNHARQSVATGSRPFLQLNNQNGLPGLLFDGSNDWLTATIAGFQSLTDVTIIQVVKTATAAAADINSGRFWGFGNLSGASGSYPANRAIALISSTGLLSGERITIYLDKAATGRIGSSTYSRAANTAQLLSSSLGSGGTSLLANNQSISLGLVSGVTAIEASGPQATGYTIDNDLHIAAFRDNGTMLISPVAITLHQMIVYDRVLTAAEQTTVWNAMSGKWGIT